MMEGLKIFGRLLGNSVGTVASVLATAFFAAKTGDAAGEGAEWVKDLFSKKKDDDEEDDSSEE
jgi:hypothetical protein